MAPRALREADALAGQGTGYESRLPFALTTPSRVVSQCGNRGDFFNEP